MSDDYFHTLFGELRALRQGPIQRWQTPSLWNKLCTSYDLDPQQHTDSIVPYLCDWSIFKEEPFTAVQDLNALRAAIDIAPFATFTLNKNKQRFGDAHYIELLQAPELRYLSKLNLEWCNLTHIAIAQLARSPYLTNLKSLNLTRNAVGQDGAMSLANSTSLPNLETLYIYEGQIDDRCAEIFAHASGLRELTTLNLPHNRIGDPGAYALAEKTGLPKLKSLDLYENDITIDGARMLVANTQLRSLYLFDNAMDDDEVQAIELMASANQQVICLIDEND